jgi:hypothetical protein
MYDDRECCCVVQDLICKACGMTKIDNIKDSCACGGRYKCRFPKSQFLQKCVVVAILDDFIVMYSTLLDEKTYFQ